jgi:hypothetical protein
LGLVAKTTQQPQAVSQVLFAFLEATKIVQAKVYQWVQKTSTQL